MKTNPFSGSRGTRRALGITCVLGAAALTTQMLTGGVQAPSLGSIAASRSHTQELSFNLRPGKYGVGKAGATRGDDEDSADTPRPTAGQEPPGGGGGGEQALAERAFPNADIPASGYQNGINQYNFVANTGANTPWSELGPFNTPLNNYGNPYDMSQTSNTSGRTTAFAAVPSTCTSSGCQTFYVGTANGGVFKTTNGGKSYYNLTDKQLNTAIGYIKLDPNDSNTVYVGTGEPNGSGDSNRGIGILKSTNGGENNSWTTLGYNQFVNRAVSSIVVGSGGKIFATTANAIAGYLKPVGGTGVFAPGAPAMGLYVSNDGGQTFTLSLPSDLHGGEGASDVVQDPTDSNSLYVGFQGRGIYKYNISQGTWTQLTVGLPAGGTGGFDVVKLAAAPTTGGTGTTLYAAFSTYTPGTAEKIFKSVDNGGTTWTQLNSPDACSGQCFYDMPLAVDQSNSNLVYAGGVANYDWVFAGDPTCSIGAMPVNCSAGVMGSSDGGSTWYNSGDGAPTGTPLHPDNHVIALTPGGTVYDGNDGGLFMKTDSSNPVGHWTSLNTYDSFQFGNGPSVGPTGDIFNGLQDNGSVRYRPQDGGTFATVQGGDGGYTQADPTSPNYAFVSYYGAQMQRVDGWADSSVNYFKFGAANGNRYNTWIAPFYGDYFSLGGGNFYEPFKVVPDSNPAEANNPLKRDIFWGTFRLWRDTNSGGIDGNGDGDATNDASDTENWVPISFDLGCTSAPALTVASTKACSGHEDSVNRSRGISAIATVTGNPNTLIAGTYNGNLWLTRNAEAPVQTTAGTLGRHCDTRSTATDHSNGAYRNCRFISGVDWTLLNTPSLPYRAVKSVTFDAQDPTGNTIYVVYSGFSPEGTCTNTAPASSNLNSCATGHVFMTKDGGKTWTNIDGKTKNSTLPNLPANSIVQNPNSNVLYVAMDYGVFVSANHGNTWLRTDKGLPNAPVYGLAYNPTNDSIVASTHGRGMWSIPSH